MNRAFIAIAASATLLVASSTPANAGFDKTELKCRATVLKTGAKLSSTIVKTLTGCQKARSAGKINDTVDCTTVNSESDAKGKVAKAETKLTASVGSGTKSKCAGLATSDLMITLCAAPCEGNLSALNDADDLADCAVCIATANAVDAVARTQGAPAPSALDKTAQKCHATLGKIVSKHISTVVKARAKCQAGDEKLGGMDNTTCAGANEAKISANRTKAEASIAKSCPGTVDFADLDTCEDASLSGLQACILDTAETNAESTFVGLTGNVAEALSWANDIQPLFATECSNGFCHTSVNNAGGLEALDDCIAGYASLVNGMQTCTPTSATGRVLPGDPSGSFLISKLTGTQDCGSAMPLGGTPLDAATVIGIRSWIAAGALDDCP